MTNTLIEHVENAVAAVDTYDVWELEDLKLGDEWERLEARVEKDSGRWTMTCWSVYRHISTDIMLAVEWESGLTEGQESMHYGIVQVVEQVTRTVTDYEKVAA